MHGGTVDGRDGTSWRGPGSEVEDHEGSERAHTTRGPGLYRTEVLRQRGAWHHLEAVEFATLEGVDWFNHRDLLEGTGYVPPAELEETYYQQCEESTMVA